MTLTVSQCAERWQCDERTVLRAIREGRLNAFPLVAGSERPTWRIREADAAAFESGVVPAPTKPTQGRKRSAAGVREFF